MYPFEITTFRWRRWLFTLVRVDAGSLLLLTFVRLRRYADLREDFDDYVGS
jgi:hypothetical protein